MVSFSFCRWGDWGLAIEFIGYSKQKQRQNLSPCCPTLRLLPAPPFHHSAYGLFSGQIRFFHVEKAFTIISHYFIFSSVFKSFLCHSLLWMLLLICLMWSILEKKCFLNNDAWLELYIFICKCYMGTLSIITKHRAIMNQVQKGHNWLWHCGIYNSLRKQHLPKP